MRWKTQWKQLLVLVAVLTVLGILEADQELKPFADAVYTTVQEKVETPKIQWMANGNEVMLVNACQTYSFVAFSFVLLMAAHNLVQLRTPMLLTRYPSWYAYQRTMFCRLMVFSVVFLSIAAALVMLAEQTALVTGLAEQLFIAKQIYPKALLLYAIHMVICTAMVCLYQIKAIFAKHYLLTQALPMLFFVISGTVKGIWIQQISPFSFPVYSVMPEGGLLRVVLTYAVCFIVLLWVCRKPKKEYVAEVET